MGARVLVNRWSRRASTLTLPLVVVAAAAACGASSPATSASPSSSAATSRAPSSAPPTAPATATPTTTAAPPDDETQVRAVIDTFWREWTIATAASDPTRPELLATLEGDARDRVVEQLRKSAALGQVSVRPDGEPVPHRTLSVDVADGMAEVQECVTDDTVTVERTTQSVLNSLVHSYILKKTLVSGEGSWRIADSLKASELDQGATCGSL